MELMKYSERIEKVKERGFFTGVNEISPLPPEKIPELYHDKKFCASDNWLLMLYAREYYRGEAERRELQGDKILEVDPKKALIFKRVRKAEDAFALGVAARDKMKDRDWVSDVDFLNFLDGIDSKNERQGCIDAWVAGFHLADEKRLEEEPETEYRLNFDRMMDMREAYESGDEPELGTEANEVYHAYSECVKRLDFHDCDRYIKCLSCPGMFRILGDKKTRYGSKDYDYCEEDCADAYRAVNDICGDLIDKLSNYYTVEVPVDVSEEE